MYEVIHIEKKGILLLIIKKCVFLFDYKNTIPIIGSYKYFKTV